MRVLFVRERLAATISCLLGLMACYLMWFEAGINKPGREFSLFGDGRRTPFLEGKHPESPIAFTAIGFAAVLVGGIWNLSSTRSSEPAWWNFGFGFILIGCVFGVLLYKARYINGVDHAVIQPGFVLAMVAVSGLTCSGITVIVRTLLRR